MDVTRTTSVELRIERIEVDGVTGMDGFALRRALERELSRLMAERGVPPAWSAGSELAALAVPAVDWDGRGGEAGFATAVAGALYAGLGR